MTESAVIAFLSGRRSVLARNLTEPGPTPDEIETLLTIAMRVPDHGKLAPWRFIVISGQARDAIGEELARIFAGAEPEAHERQIEAERERLARAPLVIAVVSSPRPHPKIPDWEQTLSAGAVCQNLLSAATAMGYGAQWLTEWIAYDNEAAQVLGLHDGEKLAGLVYIGTAVEPPTERPRPDPADYVTYWPANSEGAS